MKIAFLHYHLRPGGVTTVIGQQVRALQDRCETLVLSGDAPSPDGFPAPVVHVPEIGYRSPPPNADLAQKGARAVRRAIAARWPDGADLLHVHNPILAKNADLLDILDILQAEGLPLFLQVHDFAEDGRPGTYHRRPYPENCHWGVINSRDHALLLAAGLDEKGLHRIPNRVTPLIRWPPSETVEAAESAILYPIRAIRRKNIGEAILLAHFLPRGQRLSITLPPTSPADRQSYADWKAVCRRLGLPVIFESGLHTPFPRLVRQARSLVTTSITEGFGFGFVEAWTAGKFLWGRRLSAVCRDFSDNGIDLAHLYDTLRVPLSWIGADAFIADFRQAVKAAASGFGHRFHADRLEAFLQERITAGTVDFGQLHESHQKKVIQRIAEKKGAAARLVHLNPWLAHPGFVPDENRLIAVNDRAVRRAYDPESLGETLTGIYRQAMTVSVNHRVDKDSLLGAFLQPETFCLLKWCAYAC